MGRDEYNSLLDRVASLEAEREARLEEDWRERVKSVEASVERFQARVEEDIRSVCRTIQGIHDSVNRLEILASGRFVAQEDKIEGLMDRATAFDNELRSMRARIVAIDDVTMRLEDRLLEQSFVGSGGGSGGIEEAVGGAESGSGGHFATARSSRLLTPEAPAAASLSPSTAVAERRADLVTAAHSSPSPPWKARVVLVPGNLESWSPAELGSTAHRRCATRGLIRKLSFDDSSSLAFRTKVEEAFSAALKGRAWAPLACRAPDTPVSPGSRAAAVLVPLARHFETSGGGSELWDADFLLQNCSTLQFSGPPASQLPCIYIGLSDEVLTWGEVRSLPGHDGDGGDPQAWDHDESLDGKLVARVDVGKTAAAGPGDGRQIHLGGNPSSASTAAAAAAASSSSSLVTSRKRRALSTSSNVVLPSPKRRTAPSSSAAPDKGHSASSPSTTNPTSSTSTNSSSSGITATTTNASPGTKAKEAGTKQSGIYLYPTVAQDCLYGPCSSSSTAAAVV